VRLRFVVNGQGGAHVHGAVNVDDHVNVNVDVNDGLRPVMRVVRH
jgi:hypothetical protein